MVTIPLAPRTARAIDLAIGERTDGPMFPTHDGQRLDRHGAGRIVRKVARRAGIGKAVTPHTLRHAFITAAQGRGVASDATFRVWAWGLCSWGCGVTGVRGWRAGRPQDTPWIRGSWLLVASDARMLRLNRLRRVTAGCI